jgi:uncharacterized protein with PhoU and TrkA domain
MHGVEHIVSKDTELACIIRAGIDPQKTTFVTPSEFEQQLGFIVYPAGGEVRRHFHRPVERHLTRTTEVVLLRRGRCVLDIYDEEQNLVASRELRAGDVALLVRGGHGYRMLEDTVLLEIKQGPYAGVEERELF